MAAVNFDHLGYVSITKLLKIHLDLKIIITGKHR